MKHLPNLLTLGNLFSGCIAIVFILNSQPFQASLGGLETYFVIGVEQARWGAAFIGIAAIFDLLDGFTARALNIHSPIGKDLDSLADVVSFGVAPSMILFKMLWAAWMNEPNALDVPMLVTAPAFLVACFAALRLAKFNVTPPQKSGGFIGMPTPAVGILVAAFPFINFSNPYHMGEFIQGKWSIYAVIAILCWLMVSKIRFFKLMPYKWNLASAWRSMLLVVVGVVTAIVLATSPMKIPILLAVVEAIPVVFAIYILLSLFSKAPAETELAA